MKLLSIVIFALMTLTGTPALAQEPEGEAAYRAHVKREPRVMDCVRVALRHFRVHPETLDSLRASARARALLPILTGGYRLDDARGVSAQAVTITNPTLTDANTANRVHSISAGAVWDLRELAFNPAQVQVYGLVGIQQDVMLEVVRTYYLRRQLQVRLFLKPPQDPLARATLELRVEEYAAMLDAMTGGFFSDRGKKDDE
jgi:hypothetical protein